MAEVTEAPKKTEVTQGQGPEVKVARPAATLMPWTEPTFAFMRRFSEEMDRLFEDFGFGFGRGRWQSPGARRSRSRSPRRADPSPPRTSASASAGACRLPSV